MDINNKLFPYPVLCSYNDDFNSSIFRYNLTKTSSFKEISIQYDIENSNNEINEMIDNNNLEYVLHIECPYTSYRKIVKTKDKNGIFNIPTSKVDETITINLFIIAKYNIENYTNSDFNVDYAGVSFDIMKGNIIAIGDTYKINIEKQEENLSKIDSIFSIAMRAADDVSEIKIELNSNKIKLMLNIEDYINYNKIVNNPIFLPTLQSVLIFPALIYTFEDLKNGGFEDYADRPWFLSMQKTFEKNGKSLSKELLENKSSFELAQIVLDSPVKRAFEQLVNMDFSEEEEF